MKLESLIQSDMVLRGRFASREELLEALLNHVFRRRKSGLDAAAARDAIQKREQQSSTLLPSGLAIPHARIGGFDDIIIALGIPDEAIACPDGSLKMMALFFLGESRSSLYLNCVAAFTKMSQDADFFDSLCKAPPQQFRSLIAGKAFEVTKVVTVGSLMDTQPLTLKPDQSLKTALDEFAAKGCGFAPVVDGSGKLVGELSLSEVFALGVPDYAVQVRNLSFMRDFEPFKDLLAKEESLTVAKAMRKSKVVLADDASLMEAVMIFTQTNRHHVPVLRGDKLAGVITYIDILKKFLRP
jgi:PTS system nitrogen regulatory IIA component